jgi:hypothetical protein
MRMLRDMRISWTRTHGPHAQLDDVELDDAQLDHSQLDDVQVDVVSFSPFLPPHSPKR